MHIVRMVLALSAFTLVLLNPPLVLGQDRPKADPPEQKPKSWWTQLRRTDWQSVLPINLRPSPPVWSASSKQPGPAVAELLKVTPEEFLKRFDKNGDGFLSKDELPGRLSDFLERADGNKDGKLDRAEIAALQAFLRKQFDPPQPAPNQEQLDQIVAKFLARLDANKDGKISKDEAMGPLLEGFAQFDANKDGVLDRDELRKFAAQFAPGVAKPGKPKPPEPAVEIPDFDAFDQNADGRLTPEEVKGAPFANQFTAMDANKDGKVDRKEFEGYFRKRAVKKEAEKKGK